MTQQLALADWLEELAVYGTARRFYDAETAHHLSQAINYLYLVKLATDRQEPFSMGAPAPSCSNFGTGR